jgi:hypothetical protein
MIVIVCGGRDFTDAKLLNEALNAVHAARPISMLVQGEASGADTLAKEWAFRNEMNSIGYRAEWEKHGRGAGPIRNDRMLRTGAPLIVAFEGGRGTRNMKTIADQAGRLVLSVKRNANGSLEFHRQGACAPISL